MSETLKNNEVLVEVCELIVRKYERKLQNSITPKFLSFFSSAQYDIELVHTYIEWFHDHFQEYKEFIRKLRLINVLYTDHWIKQEKFKCSLLSQSTNVFYNALLTYYASAFEILSRK